MQKAVKKNARLLNRTFRENMSRKMIQPSTKENNKFVEERIWDLGFFPYDYLQVYNKTSIVQDSSRTITSLRTTGTGIPIGQVEPYHKCSRLLCNTF